VSWHTAILPNESNLQGGRTTVTTFILTWNPAKWDWAERLDLVRDTAAGNSAPDTWSTGHRTGGISPGDRAFLLQQGDGPRGVTASGTFTSDVDPDRHWDPSKTEDANYAHVTWDTVLDDDDILPVADLIAEVEGLNWSAIPAGGVTLHQPGAATLEDLWADHTGSTGTATSLAASSRRSGRQSDAVRRAAVEDHAQAMLEEHYRNDGWTVQDTRYGNPYDATATKAGRTLYLEAKGTESIGTTVEVTKGEVNHAKNNPGQCVMGIVSGIAIQADGTSAQPGTGMLHLYDWDPSAGTLTPTRFDWTP
jgi:Domain of unknown function (DUF3883)